MNVTCPRRAARARASVYSGNSCSFLTRSCPSSAKPSTPHPLTPPPPPAPHLWPASATLDARGSLWLAGREAAALARTYGTPLYVFDEATIRAACRGFRQALAAAWEGRESAVAYAGKSYLSPALCALLRGEDMELDVVSAGGLGIVLAGRVSPPSRPPPGEHQAPGQ